MVANKALALAFLVSSCHFDLVSSRTPLTRERRLGPLVGSSWAHTRDLQRTLDQALTEAVGVEAVTVDAKNRSVQIVEALRPIYKALPKNELGLLGHSAVRYALHRYFVKNHGMYVKGFDPNGDAWASAASPTAILEDRVPTYVQHLFEERLKQGFSLEELALLAGTFEHFIHDESVAKLKRAYTLTGLSVGGSVSRESFSHVLDVYMFIYLLGGDADLAEMPPDQVEAAIKNMSITYPGWDEVHTFVHGIEAQVLQPTDIDVPFALAKKIVEIITQRFGRQQDTECRGLEKALFDKELRGTGRVRLSDFYQAGWNFKESAEYLKTIGALDEHFPDKGSSRQHVIISNYITSSSNCVSTSSMFSLCCIDHCEDLLAQLEKSIAAPHAKPERIAELVAAMPSATVSAPRQLSASLISHLHEIAKNHSGRVPLHGRLFAQWLHHAYPRECPFPARSGTTKSYTPDDWLRETSTRAEASEDMIAALIEEAREWEEHSQVKDLVDGDMENTLPWIQEEELVYSHHQKPTVKHELAVVTRALAAIAVLFAMGHAILQAIGPVVSAKSVSQKCAYV